mmetsp:Transcript_44865/g.101287  ORF Transcript_44865/g.101287 Transcript_44865/m.101287 type:complete len:309 (+) Transcript_44865:298-1224(+)
MAERPRPPRAPASYSYTTVARARRSNSSMLCCAARLDGAVGTTDEAECDRRLPARGGLLKRSFDELKRRAISVCSSLRRSTPTSARRAVDASEARESSLTESSDSAEPTEAASSPASCTAAAAGGMVAVARCPAAARAAKPRQRAASAAAAERFAPASASAQVLAAWASASRSLSTKTIASKAAEHWASRAAPSSAPVLAPRLAPAALAPGLAPPGSSVSGWSSRGMRRASRPVCCRVAVASLGLGLLVSAWRCDCWAAQSLASRALCQSRHTVTWLSMSSSSAVASAWRAFRQALRSAAASEKCHDT